MSDFLPPRGIRRKFRRNDGLFGVQTFASIDTDIGVAIYVRDDLLRTRCLHDNHLYFVAHRRRFAVIKMIAADYTIALARAARLVHLASSKSIVALSIPPPPRSILIDPRTRARGWRRATFELPPLKPIEFSSLLNEHRVLVYRG